MTNYEPSDGLERCKRAEPAPGAGHTSVPERARAFEFRSDAVFPTVPDGLPGVMNEHATIRRYDARDRSAVWRVHDRVLRAAWDAFDPEYNRYLRHIQREFLDAGGEFLVADAGPTADPTPDSDSGVVAIGGYQPLATEVHSLSDLGLVGVRYAPEEAVRVRSVAVDPEWQGRGVGTALMGELQRRAAEAHELVVLQSPAALPETHRFYESLGYERVPGGEDDKYVWFRLEL